MTVTTRHGHSGHDVNISGHWHNDSTGGITVWCYTCQTEVASYCDDDGLPWTEFKAMVDDSVASGKVGGKDCGE